MILTADTFKLRQRQEFTDRESWLAARRGHIGGSEAAAICGVSPWASAFDVWLFHTTGLAGEVGEPAYWGTKHERALLEWLQENRPDLQISHSELTIYTNDDYPFMACTPDGFAFGDDGMALIEAKCTGVHMVDRWGDEGTDQVPDEVLIQCLHSLIILNLQTCYIPLLIGGNQGRLYIVQRGEETKATEQKIIAAEREFWEKYVLTGDEPELGDSKGAENYLKKKFPRHEGEDPAVATEPEAAEIYKLKELFLVKDAAEKVYKAQANEVKGLIGDRPGLIAPAGKVTWKRTRDAEKTDWQLVALQLQPIVNEATFKQAVVDQTATKPGYRVFLKPRNWGKE